MKKWHDGLIFIEGLTVFEAEELCKDTDINDEAIMYLQGSLVDLTPTFFVRLVSSVIRGYEEKISDSVVNMVYKLANYNYSESCYDVNVDYTIFRLWAHAVAEKNNIDLELGEYGDEARDTDKTE